MSAATHALLEGEVDGLRPSCVDVKGKGMMETFTYQPRPPVEGAAPNTVDHAAWAAWAADQAGAEKKVQQPPQTWQQSSWLPLSADSRSAAASRATATNPKDLREILGVIVNASGRSTVNMRLTMNRRSSAVTTAAAVAAAQAALLQAASASEYRVTSAPLGGLL